MFLLEALGENYFLFLSEAHFLHLQNQWEELLSGKIGVSIPSEGGSVKGS